jgi:peptidoglycan/xylan/chitin deacetylase (PgdA/CDA1 family)
MIGWMDTLAIGAVGYAGVLGSTASLLYHNSPIIAPVITRCAGANSVALTFDDGPTPQFTIPVLKCLESVGAKATFFCIGENMAAHRSLVKDMLAAGHCIANHTWHHDHAGILGSKHYWLSELQRTSYLIEDISGACPRLFRAPMGFKIWNQAAAVKKMGMKYVGWRAWAWDTTGINAERIFRRITRRLSPGDIILLHDGLEYARRHETQTATVAALPHILEYIRQHGWYMNSLAML